MNSAPARGAINHIGGLRSALPLTTDIVQPAASRPKSAISGLMRCSKLRLLVDHLVCAGERRGGKIEAEHFSGLEVDDQLVFGRRLQCEHFKQP